MALEKFEGRPIGEPSAVRATAAFPENFREQAPSVVNAILEVTDESGSLPLQELGDRSFFVDLDSETVTLDEAYFNVVSADGQLVARFGFPVYVPGE